MLESLCELLNYWNNVDIDIAHNKKLIYNV